MENRKSKTQLKGVLMLLLTALIWGSSFVAQSVGMEKIEAFTFNGIRTLMGAAFLLPFILIKDRIAAGKMNEEARRERKEKYKNTLKAGLPVGLVFFVACNLQQFAFYYSGAGKIAFMTSMYMIFVPLMGRFIGKKIKPVIWLCVVLGMIGMFFLCIKPGESKGLNAGDLLALGCAVMYAIHILMIERCADKVDGVMLSCTQFVISGVITCILMFVFETPQMSNIRAAIIPLLYSGIMSCGLAYTFQIVGQKYTDAAVATLLMCMESVFAVLSAALVLGEMMSARETLGCVIMFTAVILSQITEFMPEKTPEKF